MKFLSRLLVLLTIASTITIHCAEEKATTSYLGSAWGYVAGLGSYVGSWYEWLTSFLVDHRSLAETRSDNRANKTYFFHEVEKADKLITQAEELHAQVIELRAEKKALDQTIRSNITIYIKSLEALRENLTLIQFRLSPDYVEKAGETIIENFKNVKNFDPLTVYPFMAKFFAEQKIITIAEPSQKVIKAMGDVIRTRFSAEEIAEKLNILIEKLKEQQPETLPLLRQILYLFRNNYTKQQFDAFLLDGNEGGLFTLHIVDTDGSKMDRLNNLMERLQMVKAELQNDVR